MKVRVANMLICRHFDRWCESIKDENVRNLVKENTILTGGSIVTLLTENSVNDFDFYFRNKETALAVAKYYVNQLKKNPPRFVTGDAVSIWVEHDKDPDPNRVKIVVKSAGVTGADGSVPYGYFEQNPDVNQEEFLDNMIKVADEKEDKDKSKEPFRPVFATSNAISLSDKTQVIIRFYGEPAQIHENYDFVHCTNYWTSWERRVTVNAEALECILTKELRYIGSKYPVCSMFRVRKFIQRGWTITAGQMMKIAFQINDLDLDKYEVLEDQLTGVDYAFFSQLLDAVRAKDASNVDRAYIMSLIDRMV